MIGMKEAMIGKIAFGDEQEGGDEGYQPHGETVSSVPPSGNVIRHVAAKIAALIASNRK